MPGLLRGMARTAVVVVRSRDLAPRDRRLLWAILALATLSHGLLDTLTDGGRGVALLAPFDNRRFFFPFRPIRVANFGVRWLFTRRGAVVLTNEVKWVWLPSAALAGLALLARRLF